jgi:hypothetical protein
LLFLAGSRHCRRYGGWESCLSIHSLEKHFNFFTFRNGVYIYSTDNNRQPTATTQ